MAVATRVRGVMIGNGRNNAFNATQPGVSVNIAASTAAATNVQLGSTAKLIRIATTGNIYLSIGTGSQTAVASTSLLQPQLTSELYVVDPLMSVSCLAIGSAATVTVTEATLST
jgi:hypothetical protein